HTRFSRDWSSDVCSSDLPVRPAHGDGGTVVALHLPPALRAHERGARGGRDIGPGGVRGPPAVLPPATAAPTRHPRAAGGPGGRGRGPRDRALPGRTAGPPTRRRGSCPPARGRAR